MPFGVSAMARPLKIAPGTLAPTSASVDPAAGTSGLQPLITPASEENRKRAVPEAMPERTSNPVPGLKTVPVGLPSGMVTVSGRFVMSGELPVAPEYSVDTPVPLSATQAGVA